MKGRALLQYLIDTSDILPAKKQEATEYLAKLEENARKIENLFEFLNDEYLHEEDRQKILRFLKGS